MRLTRLFLLFGLLVGVALVYAVKRDVLGPRGYIHIDYIVSLFAMILMMWLCVYSVRTYIRDRKMRRRDSK